MNYHVTGLISAFVVAISLCGIALQVKLVWKRKRDFYEGFLDGERPTSILSLNRFYTSFFAFYAMFFYGMCLNDFNHYLVWPRTVALLLLLIILYEIKLDRQSRSSFIAFVSALFLLFIAIVIPLIGVRTYLHSMGISRSLVMLSTILLVQGFFHQVARIRKSGRTGALSLAMHQLYFLKDVSTMIFGISMGTKNGWPVFLYHGVSMTMQLVTMWHFRWVRYSKVALERKKEYDSVVNV